MSAPDDDVLDCDHEGWELEEDEHLAQCLHDSDAARRLAHDESRWDAAGTNGYEL